MPAFNGTLMTNEIFPALFNMIISQQVFADNIDDTKSSLLDAARVDGSMYGDTKLYYATNVLQSYEWGADAEAPNLLNLYRPDAPKCQAIRLDIFRQIPLTIDYYLTKRAFMNSNVFGEFTSVMLGWIRDTKRIHEATLYNAFIGTNETEIGQQSLTVTLPAAATSSNTPPEVEAINRLTAQTIATFMSDLLVALEDVTTDYNDYGFLRSYNSNSLIAVWNSEAINKINKLDIPMIFNGLDIDKKGEYTLPPRFFGTVNTTGGTVAASNTTIRSLIETTYTVSEVDYHVFPGELLPSGAVYLANETYTVDDTILFKLIHKRSVPFMSAFEAATSFQNAKSLTENQYLTWGYNTLEHLMNYPFITVRGSRKL